MPHTCCFLPATGARGSCVYMTESTTNCSAKSKSTSQPKRETRNGGGEAGVSTLNIILESYCIRGEMGIQKGSEGGVNGPFWSSCRNENFACERRDHGDNMGVPGAQQTSPSTRTASPARSHTLPLLPSRSLLQVALGQVPKGHSGCHGGAAHLDR